MDRSNRDATVNTDYRAAIGPNDKSPLQSICEMLGWCFRNLCAISTNQCVATAWIVRLQLSLSCLGKNVN